MNISMTLLGALVAELIGGVMDIVLLNLSVCNVVREFWRIVVAVDKF